MVLEIPIPVTFSLYMETDKSIIARDLVIDGHTFLQSTAIPKTCIANMTTNKKGVTTADVEKWVLKQRKEESQQVDVKAEIADLLAMNDMPF